MTISRLTDRGKKILRLIINNYISTGNPVGSFALVKNFGLPCSSATVRKTMARLTDDGYITQPHTSAGRVPTEKGIQFYVGTLLYNSKLSKEKRVDINRRYNEMEGTLDEIMEETSRVLSDISNCAGLATAPITKYTKIKSAELVKLGESKVLVIFVLEGGITEKTLIRMEREIHPDVLESMSRYLSDISIGFTIEEVKTKVVEQLKNERQLYGELLKSLLDINKAFEKKGQADIFIKGQTSIFENAQFSDPTQLRELIKTLEEKEILVDILDDAIQEDGTSVFVGTSNGIIQGYSLVVAPYGKERRLGTLGVLGPLRMDYSQIIPLVDYTAGVVSRYIDEGGF